MNRLALSTAALAVAMMLGCSSPSDTSSTDQSVDSTESPLSTVHCDVDVDVESDCDGAGPKAYTLTSVDGSLVSGVNGFGQTINASFTSSTKFRQANLNRFIPNEPIFPILVAYNAAVQSHSADIASRIEVLASFGGQARLNVKNGLIGSFRPVP